VLENIPILVIGDRPLSGGLLRRSDRLLVGQNYVSTDRPTQSPHQRVAGHDRGAEARLTGTRLREAWGSFLGRFLWQWFVTPTFDPARVFPVSCAVVEREETLVGTDDRKDGPTAGGMGVCARAGSGGIVACAQAAARRPQGQSPRPALPVWQVRNGRIEVRRVTDQAGIALYTSKEAADAGTLVLSNTFTQYQSRVPARRRTMTDVSSISVS